MKTFYTSKTGKLYGLISRALKRLYTDCFLILPVQSIIFSLIFITGCNSDFEILLHEHGAIYWTEVSGTINSIKRDRSDQKTIMTLSHTPLDIEIYNDKIYWTEYTGSEYRIKKSRLDGSGEITMYNISASSSDGPTSIAIDRREGTIFWNEYNLSSGHNDIWNSVMSSDIQSPVKWINYINNPNNHKYTYAICIDSINRKIYFTANSCYDNGITLGSGTYGGIFIYELDTYNVYIFDISDNGPATVPFRDIAVDGEEGYVYYGINTNTLPLCIRRRDLSLNNPVTWIPAAGFDIHHIALDLKHRKIYWTSETDNSIYRADLDVQNSDVEKFLQLDSKPTAITIYQ